jgi:type I restriction enzyme S subunit
LGLAREDFLAFPAPEPTSRQLRIVDTLTVLDDKIELNRRMSETLEAMARALFKSWFVDFDPVRAKMEGRDPGLPKPLADLFPDALTEHPELGEIPERWEVGTVSALADLNSESWSRSTAPEIVRYVDLANTKWGSITSIVEYPWEAAPSRARRVLQPWDTIVGTVRPGNGSYALVLEHGLTGSTGFAVLRPREPRYRSLVYCAATAPDNIDRLSHLADGAAYPAVRPEVVAATRIVTASNPILEVFARVVDPLLAKIAAAEQESRTLAALRDALLPKLISGELRLEDPERILDRAG